MYTQTFLVTSVRGRVFAPQIAASASLSFLGAKMPMPFFFTATFFLAVALCAALPFVRFSAFTAFNVAFVIVVFVVFGTTVLATVLVVVVMARERDGSARKP